MVRKVYSACLSVNEVSVNSFRCLACLLALWYSTILSFRSVYVC